MFDELDDPAPFGPRPGARELVAARAARIRRRRRTGYAASAASLVLLAAAVSAGLRGGPEGLSHLEPVTSLSPSESAWPSMVGSPTTSPMPTASPSGIEETATASPAPSEEPSYVEWADGCTPIDGLPARGTAPHPDLSLALEIADTVDADGHSTARVVVTNSSDIATYSFNVLPLTGAFIQTAAMDDEGHRSSHHHSDYIAGGAVTVGPGGADEFEVPVGLRTCADGDYTGVLPAGEYEMAVGFRWENLTVTREERPAEEVEATRDGTQGPGLPPLTQSPSAPPPTATTPPPSPSEPPSPSPISGSGVWGTAPVTVTVT